MNLEQYPDELRAYFGQELPQGPKETFQNILVYLQIENNKLLGASLEVLGKATELASLIGIKVEAILFGVSDELAKEAISYGANTVYLAPLSSYSTQKYTNILFDLIQDKKPEIVLFGQTYQALDFATRLAQRLKTALLTNCLQLDLDSANRLLIATSSIYNGLMLQETRIPAQKPQMAMVVEKKFNLGLPDKNRSGELIKI